MPVVLGLLDGVICTGLGLFSDYQRRLAAIKAYSEHEDLRAPEVISVQRFPVRPGSVCVAVLEERLL